MIHDPLAAGGADPGVGDGFLVRLAAEHFLPAVAEWPRALALADVVLGAAVGATRDVVDLGWISYPHQIGLSGKTVAPRVYIAVGVSGSVQHLAGMQTAETIIAVNKDKDAQILKVADFGIVGDLFEVVPEMIEKIKNRPATGR